MLKHTYSYLVAHAIIILFIRKSFISARGVRIDNISFALYHGVLLSGSFFYPQIHVHQILRNSTLDSCFIN